jgi:hypothetical protein
MVDRTTFLRRAAGLASIVALGGLSRVGVSPERRQTWSAVAGVPDDGGELLLIASPASSADALYSFEYQTTSAEIWKLVDPARVKRLDDGTLFASLPADTTRFRSRVTATNEQSRG